MTRISTLYDTPFYSIQKYCAESQKASKIIYLIEYPFYHTVILFLLKTFWFWSDLCHYIFDILNWICRRLFSDIYSTIVLTRQASGIFSREKIDSELTKYPNRPQWI